LRLCPAIQKLFIFGKILRGHPRQLLYIIWLRLAALCPCAFALKKGPTVLPVKDISRKGAKMQHSQPSIVTGL